MSSKSRQLSNVSNRLSVADRAALKTKIGTKEGELIWQADIGLAYTWTDTQGTDNCGTVINVGSGSWVASYSGNMSVMWFGAEGDGAVDDTGAIINAVAAGVVEFPKGIYKLAPTHIDTFIATAGQTVFTSTETYQIVRTSVLLNGKLQELKAPDSTEGSFTLSGNVITFLASLNAGDEVIISTGINLGVDTVFSNEAVLELYGDGATLGAIAGIVGNPTFNSKGAKQTGLIISGSGKAYDHFTVNDFNTTAVMVGRNNVNGAYYLKVNGIEIFNTSSELCDLGMDIGGSFPRTNGNEFTNIIIKHYQKTKIRITGNSNRISTCDFLADTSFTERNILIRDGNGNTIDNIYQEKGAYLPEILVETTAKAQSNKFTFTSLSFSGSLAGRLLIRNDSNIVTGINRFTTNFAGGYSEPDQLELFQNNDFMMNINSIPYRFASGSRAVDAVIDTSTIADDGGEATKFLLPKSLKYVFNNETLGNSAAFNMYASSSVDSHFKDQGLARIDFNYIRGKTVHLGMWIKWEPNGSITPDIHAYIRSDGTERLTEPNKWFYTTSSYYFAHDAVEENVIGGLKLMANTFDGTLYISNITMRIGKSPTLGATVSPLDTRGGTVYGSLGVAENNSSTEPDPKMFILGGMYMWSWAGKVRVSGTKPTDLSTDGSELAVV